MRTKRKTVTLLLTVTVPEDMSAIVLRREVRTLINHQSNFSHAVEPEDIRARSSRLARPASTPELLDAIKDLLAHPRPAETGHCDTPESWNARYRAYEAAWDRCRAAVRAATGEV